MTPLPDDVYMVSALLQGTRGTCNRIKVGCVIVKWDRIISSGYNDSPIGTENCLEAGCLPNKNGSCTRTVHAEIMAINACSFGILDGAVLYCTIPPCPACAKVIIDHGIKRVVYNQPYPNSQEPIQLLEENGLQVTQFKSSQENWFRY